MIAAFGITTELEPGTLAIVEAAVRAVHLTKLKPDGSGKADIKPNKIVLGLPKGLPIVLAAPADGLGLTICEGIEDALSVHVATGLGVWAAGSASFMPALSQVVPKYIEVVTICSHGDDAGRRGSESLAHELAGRGIEVRLMAFSAPRR